MGFYPENMRVVDVAVVAELRKLVALREWFWRSSGGRGSGRIRCGGGVASLREVVAPYEAVVDELKNEVKVMNAQSRDVRRG
ncbi:hypothetical protein SESBI_07162 [Sesbania bispinosa]|nr:hypothetical protein SESBI_07162 [Sesbania bispinosa]